MEAAAAKRSAATIANAETAVKQANATYASGSRLMLIVVIVAI